MIFEFNDAQILFGMFQGFKKVTPFGRAKKLRLTLPPVRRAKKVWATLFYENPFNHKIKTYFVSRFPENLFQISHLLVDKNL